jgi:hypothetical protein
MRTHRGRAIEATVDEQTQLVHHPIERVSLAGEIVAGGGSFLRAAASVAE